MVSALGKILEIIILIIAAFFSSTVSAFLGMGGGIILLGIMALFIPKGYAHGFLSISQISIVQYLVSRSYEPILDKGIKWNSINFEWPCRDPLISSRDNKHPNINNQNFIFENWNKKF